MDTISTKVHRKLNLNQKPDYCRFSHSGRIVSSLVVFDDHIHNQHVIKLFWGGHRITNQHRNIKSASSIHLSYCKF